MVEIIYYSKYFLNTITYSLNYKTPNICLTLIVKLNSITVITVIRLQNYGYYSKLLVRYYSCLIETLFL